MVANLKRRADEVGLTIADLCIGDGQNLPFDNDVFDGAFSMVGLIFFPDRIAGFRELRQVLKTGRRAVVSSISQLLSQAALVFEGISSMLPGLLNAEGKAPLSDPEVFTSEMSVIGFRKVTIHKIKHTVITPSLTEYWTKT